MTPTFKNQPLENHLSPERPWVLFMTWRDLLFASWRVPLEVLRPIVPADLEIDTFDGTAWVSMVPMGVTDMHWRGIPPIPGMEGFRELNLRTYVKSPTRPGVYFLSIECPASFSDWIARHGFGAPYLEAYIVTCCQDGVYHFASERTEKGQPPAAFFGKFRPLGDGVAPAPGSLEQFLTERYSLYFVKDGVVHRGDIEHAEWQLQKCEIEISVNTIPAAKGLSLPAAPDHVAFVSCIDTLVAPPVREPQSKKAAQ